MDLLSRACHTFLGSRDVCHVLNTVRRLTLCDFLQVNHWNPYSVSNGFRDVKARMYLGHDLAFLSSHEGNRHSYVTWPI